MSEECGVRIPRETAVRLQKYPDACRDYAAPSRLAHGGPFYAMVAAMFAVSDW